MMLKTINALTVALLLTAGAYAQNSPLPPTPVMPPEAHQRHRDLAPDQRAALKAQRKTELANLSPADRKAVRSARREKAQARLAAMPADKRERLVERRRMKATTKRKQEKS